MRVNKPLLFGSLAISAIVSVAIGYVIGNRDISPAEAVFVASSTPDLTPTLGTNAAVAGKRLPAVDLDMLNGASVNTADLLGAPLIINFWTSSCRPCKKELPDFAAVHAEFGDQVRFIGVNSLGPSDSEESFARDRGVAYELLYDSDGAFASELGLATQPVTLFISADGTVVKQTGEIDAAGLRAAISQLLP